MTSRMTQVASALALAAALTPAAAHGQESRPDAAAERFDVPAPSRKHGATVARITTATFARRRLGAAGHGRRLRLATEWSAQQQTLLVLDGATRDGRDWVKVLLAHRPNGSTGWVPRDHVALARARYWIDVRTGTRRVTVYRDGKRLRRFSAVVGKPSTPTPHGLAAIYEINRQPNPRAFLGPWVLSITAHSEVLLNFGGGRGRAAIHGRGGASLRDPLGSAGSHGCVRVLNRQVTWLARTIPRGTPVDIRR